MKLKLRGSSLGDVDAAVGAGHGGREERLLVSAAGGLQADEDEPIGELQGGGDGGGEPLGVVAFAFGGGLENDAVDDGFERVVALLVEAHALFDFGEGAVDADAVALLVEGFELFAELAFAAADNGGEDGDALAGGVGVAGGDLLDDLVGALA